MTAQEQEQFINAIALMSEETTNTTKQKGFDDEKRHPGLLIALIHAELSEALEAYRIGNPPCEKGIPISAVEEELADTAIRLFHLAFIEGFDLGKAIIIKAEYNKTRPLKHGGRLF